MAVKIPSQSLLLIKNVSRCYPLHFLVNANDHPQNKAVIAMFQGHGPLGPNKTISC